MNKTQAMRYNEAVLKAAKVILYSSTEADRYQRALDEAERISKEFRENGENTPFSTLSDILFAFHNEVS